VAVALTLCLLIAIMAPRARGQDALPPAPGQSGVTSAAPPAGIEDRLAPGLPLTDKEKASIARAKADPSPLNLGELAALRHDLAREYQRAAARSGDTDTLKVAILYAASAVDLNPDERGYRTALGGLYSQYTATEVVAGFAALEAFGAAWAAEATTAAQPQGDDTLLRSHQHRMRMDHIARTYQGDRFQIYRSALDRAIPGPVAKGNPGPGLNEDTRRLLSDELADLAEIQGNLDTRQARWRARLVELEKSPDSTATLALDNVRSQLSRLEAEAAANRAVRTQLEKLLNGEAISADRSIAAPLKSGTAPLHVRPALAIAREILSLAPPQDTKAPFQSADPNLPPNLTTLIDRARKAGARGFVEPGESKSAIDHDLLERLSRVAAAASHPKSETPVAAAVVGTSAPEESVANPDAPPAPTLRIVYGVHARTRPQTDQDPRFTRSATVEGSVPVGTKLTLEAEVEIPSANPQPWAGFAWVLYDMNGSNKGPVNLGKQVNLGKPVTFNDMGAVQLGGHGSNQPAKTTIRFDLLTSGLAPGLYEAVLAAFYLGDNGTFDPDKALRTTVLVRAPLEIVKGEIGVYVDLPERIASPGWSPLTVITSDWIQTPYTLDVTLENLVFRDTDGETSLSAAGLSPLTHIGGIMTAPDSPAEGVGSVTVHVTDARGRSANTTRRLVIGGPPHAQLVPGLYESVEHSE